MKIACLCPTYKRPQFLANAAACFYGQDLPGGVEARLFILDDAGQFVHEYVHTQFGNLHASLYLVSQADRIPFDEGLPGKYRRLVGMARHWEADVYVVWEDDDIFLPWHLSNVVEAVSRGIHYMRLPTVYSTYGCVKGQAKRENAAGRFHSSWAFTREIYDYVDGYPITNRLDFDQQLNRKLERADPLDETRRKILADLTPGYVYRWGNNVYHGSQAGEMGFADLWQSLEHLPAPFIGQLVPQYDLQTQRTIEFIRAANPPRIVQEAR